MSEVKVKTFWSADSSMLERQVAEWLKTTNVNLENMKITQSSAFRRYAKPETTLTIFYEENE